MPPRKIEAEGSFASVYDALYDDAEFIAARTDFIRAAIGAPSSLPVLDAGCGTGVQAAALSAAGYRVVGLDLDPLMPAVARRKHPQMPLIRGDLRRLPFRATVSAVLCLESPLAYLLDDADFLLALRSLRQALIAGGRLVIDTFDYPATLGTGRIRPRHAQCGNDEMAVEVFESHSYDARARVWTMRQRFAVGERKFEVKHRLKMRGADEYAAALEEAGFVVREMMAGYPGLPERRIIAVAEAR